jgi:hypothetical protein
MDRQSEHEGVWVLTILFLLAALALKVVLAFYHNR